MHKIEPVGFTPKHLLFSFLTGVICTTLVGISLYMVSSNRYKAVLTALVYPKAVNAVKFQENVSVK